MSITSLASSSSVVICELEDDARENSFVDSATSQKLVIDSAGSMIISLT